MMKRAVFLLSIAAVGMLAGCPPLTGLEGDPNPPPASPEAPKMPGRGSDPNTGETPEPKRVRLVVTVRVTAVNVPLGMASGSEEIWSYLDEEPIRLHRAANLGRNGFRVGLGRKGSWPDLARVLKRLTGRAPKQQVTAAVPGDPMPIVLKERQEPRTIFTFHDDRTLSGQDYPAGDYILAVACTLNEDDASRLLLTAMPQVRTTRRKAGFEMGKKGPAMVMKAQVFNFPEMTFQLLVPADGYLVIGPGINARNPVSIGHHFLTHEREGIEFETLLVLHPKVLAAPLK